MALVYIYFHPRPANSELDLHIHAGGKIELHEPVDGLRGQVLDVYQPLVGAQLKLLPGVLVHMGGAEHGVNALPANSGRISLSVRRRL